MPTIKVKTLRQIAASSSESEMLRVLSLIAKDRGAARIAYVQLPMPLSLLQYGVYPRVVTTFPEYIVKEHLRLASSPFNMAELAVTTGKPVFFDQAESAEELHFVKLLSDAGLSHGIFTPIPNTESACMVYAFNNNPSRAWMLENFEIEMQDVAVVTHMTVAAKTSVCPAFKVPGFTPRVEQLLRLKIAGYTGEAAARELGIKHDTVKKMLKRASDRLGGVSTTQLIYHLTKLGVL
jgi:DNA-binding CsgD family transcriptional regulator